MPGLGEATPATGQRRKRGRGRANVSGAEQPGLGAQLTRRVSSGAITQQQAQQTMQQRQTLKKAYGPDWRTKVYGDRGYAQRTRVAAAKEPENPQVAALKKALEERRQKMLTAARGKAA